MNEAAAPRRSRWKWMRSVSVASRLAVAVVAVSVASLLVATLVGLQTGRQLTRDLNDDLLEGFSESSAFDVAGSVTAMVRAAEALAVSPQGSVALAEFADALDELRADAASSAQTRIDDLLVAYGERFVTPFAAAGVEIGQRDIVPTDPGAIALQHAYSLPSSGFSDPVDVDDARDGTRWTEIHRQVHRVYRGVVQRLGLLDVLLVERDDRRVVYSVAKQPDLGTSLEAGPFSGSVIAGAADAVIDDPDGGAIVTDLSSYLPAGLRPVGGIAAPLVDDGVVVGAIVLVYDGALITDVLTASRSWDDAGFPPTGETFMFGADGILRSDTRRFLESTGPFLRGALAEGRIDDAEEDLIRAAGTGALTLQVDEETVEAASEGDRSVGERSSLSGVQVLSTVAPVPLDDVRWYVAAEVETEVSDGRLDDFADLLIIGASILVVLVAFAAVAWSAATLAPVRDMSDRLARRRNEIGEVELPARSPEEFRQLAASFADMGRSLTAHGDDLTAARARRLELLREMLPATVAERVVAGDLESLEDVPGATVAVLVVTGLGALVRLDDSDTKRALVDELHAELDGIGRQHGVERIKIVGDAYYAACGHGRPYIDHAPRAVAFAADAADVVRELSGRHGFGLDVVAGVHTGPVTVGMTLESRLLYDVWGPTVTMAHALARVGASGQLLVSETTRRLLPSSIGTRPFELRSTDDEVDASAGTVLGRGFEVHVVESVTVAGSV